MYQYVIEIKIVSWLKTRVTEITGSLGWNQSKNVFCNVIFSVDMLRIATCLAMLPFLGAFAKLRKVIIRFIMSVRLPVRPPVRWKVLSSHCRVFNEIWYLWIFLKSVEKIQVSLKSDKNTGCCSWRPIYAYIFVMSRSFILRMRNISDNISRENRNSHFVCRNPFFRKSCRLWDNVEKYCRAGQAIDDNMAHAHCMLDTSVYKYKHSGCVIFIVFPLQQWLHERASVLCYAFTACLVLCKALQRFEKRLKSSDVVQYFLC